ncbi:MAG: ATP-dependent zinc protease [Thermodesulfobacteriota bacterium]
MRSILGIILFLLLSQSVCFSNEIKVIGWLEEVVLMPENLLFKAKMDTGALHSSLNSSHVERFVKDGKQFVRFTVLDRKNREVVLERPVVRTAKVKMRNGKPQERPVVFLDICVGNTIRTAEVNLVDRRRFLYEFLIGRSFIKGAYAIDPDAKYTMLPDCKSSQNPKAK